LEYNVSTRLYVTFHWRDFTQTLHLAFFKHGIQAMKVLLRSDNYQGHVTWRTKYLLGYIFPSTGAAFLKLGSAKGFQRFRRAKMRNGGRVLLAVLNIYVRIKIRVATFELIMPSLTVRRQSLFQCRSFPIL